MSKLGGVERLWHRLLWLGREERVVQRLRSWDERAVGLGSRGGEGGAEVAGVGMRGLLV
jgi:hypothetical protein